VPKSFRRPRLVRSYDLTALYKSIVIITQRAHPHSIPVTWSPAHTIPVLKFSHSRLAMVCLFCESKISRLAKNLITNLLQEFKYKLQSSSQLCGQRKYSQFFSPCTNKNPPIVAGIWIKLAYLLSPPLCGQKLSIHALTL